RGDGGRGSLADRRGQGHMGPEGRLHDPALGLGGAHRDDADRAHLPDHRSRDPAPPRLPARGSAPVAEAEPVRGKPAAAAALAIAATLLLGAHSADAETLRVAKGGPQSFSFSPVDIALAQGFLQKRGLDATLSNFDGAAKEHQAIAAGDIDIAL